MLNGSRLFYSLCTWGVRFILIRGGMFQGFDLLRIIIIYTNDLNPVYKIINLRDLKFEK